MSRAQLPAQLPAACRRRTDWVLTSGRCPSGCALPPGTLCCACTECCFDAAAYVHRCAVFPALQAAQGGGAAAAGGWHPTERATGAGASQGGSLLLMSAPPAAAQPAAQPAGSTVRPCRRGAAAACMCNGTDNGPPLFCCRRGRPRRCTILQCCTLFLPCCMLRVK